MAAATKAIQVHSSSLHSLKFTQVHIPSPVEEHIP